MSLDLRAALNAMSDVVNNRPLPLREFDQIYMKVGDMVIHAEYLSRLFNGLRVAFVGDGDAVGLALVHLHNEDVFQHGPASITVLDFDERVVNSIKHFAADYECGHRISAQLYNVIDALPNDMLHSFDAFHINPPWGRYNGGESVIAFLERGIQLLRIGGHGVVVIADDPSLPWANEVMSRVQDVAISNGMVITEMIPQFHSYHLDDAPDLRSCTMVLRKIANECVRNESLSGDRLENFYGRTKGLRVQYVREVSPGRQKVADDRTYRLEPIQG